MGPPDWWGWSPGEDRPEPQRHDLGHDSGPEEGGGVEGGSLTRVGEVHLRLDQHALRWNGGGAFTVSVDWSLVRY